LEDSYSPRLRVVKPPDETYDITTFTMPIQETLTEREIPRITRDTR
jgi:hypothetical protein